MYLRTSCFVNLRFLTFVCVCLSKICRYYTDAASATQLGGWARSAKAKKGTGSLTFLQVKEAGHMVPMDQPQAALNLINSFTMNKPYY